MDKHIEINTLQLRYWKKALDELGKTKFPVAVRNTMNNMAFAMKGSRSGAGYIERRSRTEFDYRRNRTLITKLSGAKKATGMDVSSMKSGAGIFEVSGRSKVANRMENQESGTPLKHAFTPQKAARVGNNVNKPIAGRFKHKKLRFTDVTNMQPQDRFRSMIVAAKQGQPILIKSRRKNKVYLTMPSKVLKNVRNKSGGKYNSKKVELKFLYSKNTNKMANLKKKRPFVQLAGEDALKDFPKLFHKEINKALNKLKK